MANSGDGDPTGWGLAPGIVAAGRRGDLFALFEIKQTLTARLGVQRGFDAYRQAMGLPDTDHIRPRPLRGLREIGTERSVTFHETEPGGEPFAIAPPRVVGEGNHRRLEGVARSIFVSCMPDARVRGRSAFIEVDDVALLDYEGSELVRLDDRLDFDPSVFHAVHDNELWMVAPKEEVCSIEIDEAFMLLGPHTRAFGHWMWEYLPKYLVASMAGMPPAVPVLIDRNMPDTHRQALELMLPKGSQIIELPQFVTARVRRLWCAPSQMHMPLLEKMNGRFKWDYLASPPARFARIIHEMVRRVEPTLTPEGGGERVFLARKEHNHRKMVNYRVIEAVAQAHGFRLVYAEDLDFAEQVRLMRAARFVAAPEGSALFLAFFATPGTRVCILEHPHTAGLPLLTGLLSEIGIDVTVVTGPYVRVCVEWPHLSDYQIDEVAFSRFLNHWLNGQEATWFGRVTARLRRGYG